MDASMERGCRQRRVAITLAVLLACCPWAFGLDPSLDINQYAHTAWKVRDGFPKGIVQSIAQTPDGYLWLGTESGLLRFDGVRAVAWQPPPEQHLPSDYVARLLAARDGTLWIGTFKGLASWKNGKVTQYSELAGLAVNALFEDRDGTVWAGGFAYKPPGKLCAIQKGIVHCYGEDGSLGNGVLWLYEDNANLWAGVLNGLWRWRPGIPKFYSLAGEPNGIQALAKDANGTLLIGMGGKVVRFISGKVETAYRLPGVARQSHCMRLLRDCDGGLWAGTLEHGLVHVHNGTTDIFARFDGLSGDTVQSLFEDREGSIWVGTNGGFDRFRNFAVPTYSANQGLASTTVGSILATKDGGVWVGARDVLSSWNNGKITVYRNKRSAGSLGTPGSVREVIVPGLPKHEFVSLFEDDGKIWVVANGGVGYLQNDSFTSLTEVAGGIVDSVAGDHQGNIWIAHMDRGLIHLLGGRMMERIPWARLGHKDHAIALATDPSQGGVWLGFFDGGIAYLSGNRIERQYTSADGLGEGAVAALQFDREGTLWAATEGGLSRLKTGRISTLTHKNGLPCDRVNWVIEDDAGSLWAGLYCGLVRIARPELEAWAAADSDPNHRVQVAVFDNFDGVEIIPSPVGNGSPRATKSRDGKLWFTTLDGVSAIDPAHIAFNKLPPPVYIEQIIADRKTYGATPDSNRRVNLPARERDLQIDYTALSLVAPEKVFFRYKLEGWDRDWQNAGTRRQAFYSNLPPRNYRFRVMACNNSGVWNEAGTFLDFSIAPAYYQTTWFRLSCVTAFLVLLWGIYRLRIRQLRHQFAIGLEARVSERTRIARDLHDTLLQSFQGLMLHFQTGIDLLPGRPAEARKTLEIAIDRADQAIAEGRDAVQGLRTSTLETNDLASAIRTLGEELRAEGTNQSSALFEMEVEGTAQNLHPILRDEVYRITAEALRNAFRHARAQRIEVEILYGERWLRLRVRDDGKGIDPKLLSGDGLAGHYGLHGMRERAKVVGGKLAVWSKLDSGTEVELSIPASTAYANPARHRSWLSEKLTGQRRGFKETDVKETKTKV